MRKEFLILILFLCSCTAHEKTPPGVLSEEQMVNVLAQVYVMEERINRQGFMPDSAHKVFQIMNAKLSEKVNVPDSVFRASMEYYIDRPQRLERIYTALIDSLSLKEQRTPFRADQ